MRFQNGDIVRISKTFTDLEDEPEYPNNRNGKVISIDCLRTYSIYVRFDDVQYDSDDSKSEFNENELRLVRRG